MTSHPDAERIWLHAQRALSDADAGDPAVAEHLSVGCETCRVVYDAARADAATITLGAEPREPSAAVRTRLLSRFVAVLPAEGTADDLRAPKAAPHWPMALPIAAGLVGLGIAVGAFSHAAWSGGASEAPPAPAPARVAEAAPDPEAALRLASLEDERDALHAQLEAERARLATAEAEAADVAQTHAGLMERLQATERGLEASRLAARRLTEERDELENALVKANQAVALLESPGVEWVVLSNEDDATRGAARFFWEWEERDCLIDGGDLPRLEPGQSYALWVAYEDAPPALVTTFAPDAHGAARLLAPLPPGEGEVRTVRITIEEGPNPVSPAGTTLLAGVLF